MKKIVVFLLSIALVGGIITPADARTRTPWNDGSAPVIMINHDDMITDVKEVKLQLHIVNASEMLISNYPGFQDASWQPYQAELDWDVWSEWGSVKVYVMFRNYYGTSPIYYDSIFYQNTISTNRKSFAEWLAIAEGRADMKGNAIGDASSGSQIVSAVTLPDGINPGDIVKAQGHSAIYYIGADHKRHVYPSIKEYSSWNQTFVAVKEIPVSVISQITPGKSITIRPGTNLIKIASNSKVYAVDEDGKLRWVTSTSVAVAMYGPNWEDRIVDLGASRFADYEMGASVTTPAYIDGTVVRGFDGDLYKVRNQKLQKLSPDGFLFNDYQDTFVVTMSRSNQLAQGAEDITGWITDSLPSNTLSIATTN